MSNRTPDQNIPHFLRAIERAIEETLIEATDKTSDIMENYAPKDTGTLKKSISTELQQGSVVKYEDEIISVPYHPIGYEKENPNDFIAFRELSVNAPYALFVEYGVPAFATPKTRFPGSPAQPYIRPAMDELELVLANKVMQENVKKWMMLKGFKRIR